MQAPKPCPFIRKLLEILRDDRFSSIIRAEFPGSFKIFDRGAFCKYVLKKCFKTSTFESFVRQLNKYNFKKSRNEDVFNNKDFIPDDFEALGKIRIKSPCSTLACIREDAQGLSLFNHTVVKALKRLTKIISKLSQIRNGERNVWRILVFENFDVSEIVNTLENNGFEVDTVFFFKDFESKIFTRNYDYLIIDLELYEIFMKIGGVRANKLNLKIVITTDSNVCGHGINVHRVLVKPYDDKQVLAIIKQ